MRTLHSATLTLEPLLESHADAMFDVLSAPQMYAYIPGKPPGSVGALRERYRRLESRRSADGAAALYCTIDPWNGRSLRLVERLAFQEIAPREYPHGASEPHDRVFRRAPRRPT